VQFVGVLALGGYIATTLMLFPWYLAYFNLLAGGPDGGYRYLVDSNLDWGQTWKALRAYVDARGIAEFGLSQYTINDPHAYGLDYTPLPPWPDAPPVLPQRFAPSSGVYAISSTQLQGVVVADSEMFDYFRNLSPVAKIGHAMFVYEVPVRPPVHWVAQCTTPVAPLPEEVIYEGFGERALRLVYFDCAQTWLVPAGNGWYVTHGWHRTTRGAEILWALDDSPQYEKWRDVILGRARLAYEQKRKGLLPPFAIYEWFEQKPPGVGDSVLSGDSVVYAAPSAWPPQQVVSEGDAMTPPVYVGDALLFLGYMVDEASVKPGQEITLQMRWRLRQRPQQAFSLMAHLLDVNGIPLAVADGLGVGIEQLQAGDTLIQRHTFTIPTEASPGVYWIQIGAYTYPNVQRLSIMRQDHMPMAGVDSPDRLIIGHVEVVPP
jgi:hypothetical protein